MPAARITIAMTIPTIAPHADATSSETHYELEIPRSTNWLQATPNATQTRSDIVNFAEVG